MIKFEEYFNILNESVSRTNRYMNMFSFPIKVAPHFRDFLSKFLKDNVIPTLKRDDIIQWYCRLYVLSILDAISKDKHSQNVYNQNLKQINNTTNHYLKNFGYSSRDEFIEDIKISTNRGDMENALLRSLGHFFSLGISKIDNYRFSNQKISDVISQFEEWEDEWKKEAVSSFDDTEEHPTQTVLKRYPNGFEWVSLNKTYCEKEGSAMGHCGNRPSQRQGDNVISLRKVEMRGKQRFVRPSLTFIYNNIDNEFGEMKGRANEKPNQKYHEYIVDLLLLKDETGDFLFKKLNPNYGYMTENNFRISDLDKKYLQKIKDQRPDIISSYDEYKISGYSEEYVKKIKQDLEKTNLKVIHLQNFNFSKTHPIRITEQINKYEFIEKIAIEKLYGDAEKAINYINGEEELYIDSEFDSNSFEFILNLTNRKYPKFQKELQEYIKNNYDIEDELIYISEMAEYLYDNNDSLVDSARNAHSNAANSGFINNIRDDLLLYIESSDIEYYSTEDTNSEVRPLEISILENNIIWGMSAEDLNNIIASAEYVKTSKPFNKLILDFVEIVENKKFSLDRKDYEGFDTDYAISSFIEEIPFKII